MVGTTTSTLPKQDKFAPKAIKFVLLGYDMHQKGYRLYNLGTKSYFIRRDVVFHEKKIPFIQSSLSTKDFPHFTSSNNDYITPLDIHASPLLDPQLNNIEVV